MAVEARAAKHRHDGRRHDRVSHVQGRIDCRSLEQACVRPGRRIRSRGSTAARQDEDFPSRTTQLLTASASTGRAPRHPGWSRCGCSGRSPTGWPGSASPDRRSVAIPFLVNEPLPVAKGTSPAVRPRLTNTPPFAPAAPGWIWAIRQRGPGRKSCADDAHVHRGGRDGAGCVLRQVERQCRRCRSARLVTGDRWNLVRWEQCRRELLRDRERVPSARRCAGARPKAENQECKR